MTLRRAWACGRAELPSALVPYMYVEAIERAGGRALLVPPERRGRSTRRSTRSTASSSPAASDLDPATYGKDAHPETTGTRPERDAGELALLTAALERDMPVLAVCRGSQVLNVARGGDLVQHLPDVVGDERHKHTPGVFADHDVARRAGVAPRRRCSASARRSSRITTRASAASARGCARSAWADDGTVEALEDPSKRFAVGVLWHPEAGEDRALFEALVEEARAYREERRSTYA